MRASELAALALLLLGGLLLLLQSRAVPVLSAIAATGAPAAARGGPAGFLRLGTHMIVELRDTPFDVLNCARGLNRTMPAVRPPLHLSWPSRCRATATERARAALLAAARAGSLTVIGEHFHTFPVMGLSGVLVIRPAPARAWRPRAARSAPHLCPREPEPPRADRPTRGSASS